MSPKDFRDFQATESNGTNKTKLLKDKMLAYTAIFALVGILYANAGCVTCPNQCSGHGTCNLNFVCECYDNYGIGLSHDSGDCSERICPYELAWVDTPDIYGRHHRYAECANKGICNRDSGECECFPGFEGKGCGRTTCPNDCSGHGRCSYIQDLSYGATVFDYAEGSFDGGAKTFAYYQWDASKTRGCVCDPGFADVDCSKRLCPFGTDIMDHRDNLLRAQRYQVQQVVLKDPEFSYSGYSPASGSTFAITFKSKLNETFTTIPIQLSGSSASLLASDIQLALKSLPNHVIDNVHVAAAFSSGEIYFNVSFVGDAVQGPQYYLTVEADYRGDGATPKLTGVELAARSENVTEVQLADYNSYECGRRGKCDYSTGICQCFEGYTGVACNVITALV